MKRIGLLGGMSWESSALYYRLINEGVRDRLGGLHSADCVMVSVDFAAVERLQASGDWDGAGRLLADEARALVRAGAEVVVLCTNTMHRVAEHIEDAVDVPLLHLVDVTALAIRRARLTRVALLGTRFTMGEGFYRERMARHGIETLVPDAAGQALVDRVIYEELVRGEVREASRQEYRRIVAALAADGAEGVILGCTEIELLIGESDSPVPVFASTALHAGAAVDAALEVDAAPAAPA
ncbi:aspartate/glutamate racemase family protein [Microbacterium oryzae]|uniref:Aspartate/glutamate racemase family protein n=1 Tax=Microbacterium oryzae TaxID=743009 RepID=A0A6I6DW53_9MICO|nr:aspartate/glutamate racemase family protein [Microbacterium oryzae]QGU27083.1 aspartate/glutamate racemase family protein [Microbacterium oryzae]